MWCGQYSGLNFAGSFTCINNTNKATHHTMITFQQTGCHLLQGICSSWYALEPFSHNQILLTTLIMVYAVGHLIELISTLKTFWIMLWVCTIYRPTIFNIRSHDVSYIIPITIAIGVHLKDFQFRGRRWVYHRGMTSVTRGTHYFLRSWCILWATL